MPSNRLALLTACAIAMQVLVSSAQQPPEPPKFRAGTDVVLVDFVVSDKAERPVRNLSVADFVVKEDGKDRPIVSFAAFGREPPGAAVPRSAGATVLLVDDIQLTQEQTLRLRPDLKALLAHVGERSGTLALIAPLSKVSEVRTLPVGGSELAAAVDRIVGQRIEEHSNLPVSDSEAIAIDRGDQTMLGRVVERFMAIDSALNDDQAKSLARGRGREIAGEARMRREQLYRVAEEALDWLAAQPGRHSLVMVSPGFARDPDDVRDHELLTRSLRVNAPISFLDVRGLQAVDRFKPASFSGAPNPATGDAPLARTDAAQGSAIVADDTGGMIVRNANDLAKGFGRLLDTMETYYIIGYEAPPHGKPGFHKIEVQVKTKGLTVRARRGYYDVAPVK